MSKIYKRLNTNFVVASTEIFKHNLSLKAIGLYLYIVDKPDGWNFSVEGVASQVKDGEDSIRTAIQELEQVGFLSRCQKRSGTGRFSSCDWEITDRPTKKENTPQTSGKPMKKPMSEKPTSENGAQANTKVVNNKIINNTNVLFGQSPENKEIKSLTSKRQNADPEIDRAINALKEMNGGLTQEKLNRQAVQRLRSKFGLDKAMRMMEFASKVRSKQYAPLVTNYIQLERKWPELVAYEQRLKDAKQNTTAAFFEAEMEEGGGVVYA